MKIIYYDSTGRYLAVIAAAIHLGQLDSNSGLPKWNKLEELTYFNSDDRIKAGEVTFVGRDELGNDIYILGSRGVGSVIEKAIDGIKRIFDVETENIFVDLTEHEDWLFKFGLVIKSLNFPSLAKGLIYNNLADSFSKVKQIVSEVKG